MSDEPQIVTWQRKAKSGEWRTCHRPRRVKMRGAMNGVFDGWSYITAACGPLYRYRIMSGSEAVVLLSEGGKLQ